jgi:hypothetical protein
MSVDEIAGLTDPILRNLQITQRYHELALALRNAGMDEDATWCAFAVWASKTAGATIRGQELPSLVRHALSQGDATDTALHQFNHGMDAWLIRRLEHEHLLQAVETVNGQVSGSIAAGNVLVFSELAPLFTALIEGGTALEVGLANLKAQGVDTTKVDAAFTGYQQGLRQPAARPTRVLAANILAVSHEQERLQPAITEALDAAVSDVFIKLVDREITRHLPMAAARHTFDRLVADVGRVLEGAWQSALTATMLRLVTSDETLDLSHNVPPLADGIYPALLADLQGSEAELPFNQWDRTAGAGAPTGAHDWDVLEERMNYIVTLFRSRQRHPALFSPPFSDAQLAELDGGRLPEGPL